MDANIYLAKSIIDGYRNHQFKRIYPFATENVAGCFSGYDFIDKDCLTVLGSSVHFKFINSDINNLELDRSYDFMYFSNIMQYATEMYNDNMINSLSKYRELLLKFKELLNKGGSMYASYIYGIDLLAIPNMDAFCLASIEHVFEHDLIEYKSFNAFKINFSAFIEGASKDGVLVYSK